MQNLIFSLNATLPVFLVMVVGYALGQLGFLPPAFCKASDRLTFKVTLPLMLFLDMGSVDILHDFRPRFVLFCFAATLVGILTVWAGAKRFLKDKALVGEFVQAGYRSSAAVLGVAFIQNIYGSAGMAPLMILGSVPLFNIFAVLILMLESPEQRGVPDPKQLLRGVATNPILLGIVFGTVYALLPFTLPQIATKTISTLPTIALDKPPPVSPAGGVISRNNDGLNAAKPFENSVHIIHANQNKPTTIATPAKISMMRLVHLRR